MKKRSLPLVTTSDKTMLPEVLPDPRASESARRGGAGPRSRTLDRLQTLLAASAAAAALGCGEGTGGGGYAVVDPMPMPPPRCFDPSGKVRATAVFATRDGITTVRVRVEVLPGATDVALGPILGDNNNKILAQNVSPRVVTADIAPGSSSFAELQVDVSPCDTTTPGAVVVEMSWDGSKPPTEATTIATSVRADAQSWRQKMPEQKPIEQEDPRFAKPPPK
jgi:hypothetical protein